MDILELIEDTVEVDAKTFGLAVLEKVAKLDVTQEQMQEFVELVEYWTERMEDDVENLLDMIVCEDGCGCGCEDEHCHCGCEDDCECDENCECGCQDGEECTCHEEKECHCHDKNEDKKENCGCKEHKENKECKSKKESTCTCGDPNCTCGCNEGKPCTCKK